MLLTLNDVFQSVVVPRSVVGRWRVSAYVARFGWHAWKMLAFRIRDAERREDLLGTFAPVFLVGLLALWVTLLTFGYGCIFWSMRAGLTTHPDLSGCVYFAGTTLLTIGYGDIVPVWGVARFTALFAAASGLGVVAIVTAFLFQTFAAFQRREAFVVTVSERTGAPPSGVEFLLRHARLGMLADIGPVLRDAQVWIAEVLETHLAYPTLTYFRSSHDDESWVGTLGALLDASTLLVTTAALDQRGPAELVLRAGTHLAADFGAYFRLVQEPSAGVEREEFAAAYRELGAAGIPLRPLDEAWIAFAATRARYATALDAMARWWRIPPAQWVGDRSRVRFHTNVGMQTPTR